MKFERISGSSKSVYINSRDNFQQFWNDIWNKEIYCGDLSQYDAEKEDVEKLIAKVSV